MLQWEQCKKTIETEFSTVDVLEDVSNVQISPIADQIAEAADKEQLGQFLWSLIEKTTKYRPYMLAFGRFAAEKEVGIAVAEIVKRRKGNAQNRYWAGNIERALMLSETKAAMQHFDKSGLLEEYARLRETTAELLRDTVLIDTGLDENGSCTFNLGSRVVTASLQNDLTIALFDEKAGKTVKTLPKKDAGPQVHAQVAAYLAQMRKDVKNVAKARASRFFSEFLNGTEYEAGIWKKVYCGNAVLSKLASLVVWQQEKQTFTLLRNAAIAADGSVVCLNGASIKIAHPMEMESDELLAWKAYFEKNGLKQPFLQLWEPVVAEDSVKTERYEGCQIPLYRFSNQEKHGIRLEMATEFDPQRWMNRCSHVEIQMNECRLTIPKIEKDAMGNISLENYVSCGKFTYKTYTRQVNHIVVYLDKCTVLKRILEDDIGVIEQLGSFHGAQIDEFVQTAVDNHAVHVSAALLEYRNARYPDRDSFEAFTLEF